MMMDMGDMRGLSTILCMVAFFGVVFWAYGPSRKDKFEEAADLPFADEASQAKDEVK
jgi:cytochrome c oxidase cbb3-type subunit 4